MELFSNVVTLSILVKWIIIDVRVHILFILLRLFILHNFFNMPKVNKEQNKEITKKRKSLTAAQKKEICLKKISTPSLKQKELAIEYEDD